MSTRSSISRLGRDGKIGSIYCHYDGYLDGVGSEILEGFNSQNMARVLVGGGDRRSVPGERYHYECGEDWENVKPTTKIGEQEYNYVFDESVGEWFVVSEHLKGHETFETRVELTRAFIGAEEMTATLSK